MPITAYPIDILLLLSAAGGLTVGLCLSGTSMKRGTRRGIITLILFIAVVAMDLIHAVIPCLIICECMCVLAMFWIMDQ